MANTYVDKLAAAFQDELRKIAHEKQALSHGAVKNLGIAGAGIAGYELLRRANQDRKMGRAMRNQQGY